jgi:hypothetical protein
VAISYRILDTQLYHFRSGVGSFDFPPSPSLETTATHFFNPCELGGLPETMCMAMVIIVLTIVAFLIFNLKYGGGPVQSRT